RVKPVTRHIKVRKALVLFFDLDVSLGKVLVLGLDLLEPAVKELDLLRELGVLHFDSLDLSDQRAGKIHLLPLELNDSVPEPLISVHRLPGKGPPFSEHLEQFFTFGKKLQNLLRLFRHNDSSLINSGPGSLYSSSPRRRPWISEQRGSQSIDHN